MKELVEPFEYSEVFKPIQNKDIHGIEENRYFVSNFARIFDTKYNRFCKVSKRSDGYESISLNTNGNPKSYLLHRIVGLYFVPGDTNLIINHINGNKSCNHFMNLEWVTYSENNNHAFANNLSKKGEDSPKSVISEDQAIMICKCLDEHKLSYSEIALFCKINSPDAISLISAIYKGVSWRHISKNYNFSKNNYKNGRYRIFK